MFAHVHNGTVTTTADELPYAWQYPDDFPDEELAGRTVSGFRFLDADEIAEAGWVEVVDQRPTFDEATHYLADPTITVDADGTVARTWTVIERQTIPEPDPGPADDVTAALVEELTTARGKSAGSVAELNAKLNAVIDALTGTGARPGHVAGRPKG